MANLKKCRQDSSNAKATGRKFRELFPVGQNFRELLLTHLPETVFKTFARKAPYRIIETFLPSTTTSPPPTTTPPTLPQNFIT